MNKLKQLARVSKSGIVAVIRAESGEAIGEGQDVSGLNQELKAVAILNLSLIHI